MSDYSVRNEPDYAVTYDEDEIISIRKGDLRAVLDCATGSMDFGSGFFDNEQVEALRKAATMLGIDPSVVTPSNFECLYGGQHPWVWRPRTSMHRGAYTPYWWCWKCSTADYERPAPAESE